MCLMARTSEFRNAMRCSFQKEGTGASMQLGSIPSADIRCSGDCLISCQMDVAAEHSRIRDVRASFSTTVSNRLWACLPGWVGNCSSHHIAKQTSDNLHILRPLPLGCCVAQGLWLEAEEAAAGAELRKIHLEARSGALSCSTCVP